MSISIKRTVNEMRVITGTARGRKIKEPAGMDIRPTTDMVKESVFNILQFDIEGRKMLDLFAGTGQMGIEALSRGAESVTFIDSSPDAIKLVKENLAITGFADKATVIYTDALNFLKNCGKYDIIYIDPPYKSTLADEALQLINRFDILKDNGIIVCENVYGTVLPELISPYTKIKERKYGKVAITVYTKESV